MSRSLRKKRARVGTAAALLPAFAVLPVAMPPEAVADPASATCPGALTEIATCSTGRSDDGAYYAIAVPDDWNGGLVVHAHGGPDLGDASDPVRSVEDLERWSVMVQEGYAWAGSSYRRGGYGVRMAVADTEAVREIFVDEFGEPRVTFAHGQSWGGNVAARLVELHGEAYDGALLTNGVLAGGSRGYDYRVDLRVVYQYYCHNHPRPTEPQYPLWMGLREGSTMTTTGLRARLQECTGYQSAPSDRTLLQQRDLDDIVAVTGIPEQNLESHLRFATFTFRDIVQRVGGRNPFGNQAVHYSGSHDDKVLNAGVERFAPAPGARRDLSWDSDLTGEVDLPVLTMHAIDDPTAFVEHESAYRASLRGAGSADRLLQVFTREAEHSRLSSSEYAAAIAALSTWVATGVRPTPSGVAAGCRTADATYGTGCFVDPGFAPGSYASRVEARPGGQRWPAITTAQAERWERQGPIGIEP